MDDGNTVDNRTLLQCSRQRVYPLCRVVDRQWASHCPELSMLVKRFAPTGLMCSANVSSLSTLSSDAPRKVTHCTQGRYDVLLKDSCIPCWPSTTVLTRASPHDLCFVGVQLQAIRRHQAIGLVPTLYSFWRKLSTAVLLTDSQSRYSERRAAFPRHRHTVTLYSTTGTVWVP